MNKLAKEKISEEMILKLLPKRWKEATVWKRGGKCHMQSEYQLHRLKHFFNLFFPASLTAILLQTTTIFMSDQTGSCRLF